MRAVKIQVIGKVQGVSFRFSTLNKAKSLQITGWVKNQDDGSVLIHARGTDGSISSLIEWCHLGPTASIVEKVSVEDWHDSDIHHLDSFEILR